GWCKLRCALCFYIGAQRRTHVGRLRRPTSSPAHSAGRTTGATRRPNPARQRPVRALYFPHMRILVIEDDPTVGQYVKRGLEEQRWSVDLVTDGVEGERRAASEAYDLIILDMRLPKKAGL